MGQTRHSGWSGPSGSPVKGKCSSLKQTAIPRVVFIITPLKIRKPVCHFPHLWRDCFRYSGQQCFLTEGLKTGNVLKIPKPRVPGPAESADTDSISDIQPCIDVSHEKVTYKVALLLPFLHHLTPRRPLFQLIPLQRREPMYRCSGSKV